MRFARTTSRDEAFPAREASWENREAPAGLLSSAGAVRSAFVPLISTANPSVIPV